jgi:hypothetical protein
MSKDSESLKIQLWGQELHYTAYCMEKTSRHTMEAKTLISFTDFLSVTRNGWLLKDSASLVTQFHTNQVHVSVAYKSFIPKTFPARSIF